MTAEEIKEIGIPCDDTSERTLLMVECAVEWLSQHTTLRVNINDTDSLKSLPACAKAFILKYTETSDRSAGISSESLGGMSQAFDTSSSNQDIIWELAEELLSPYLKSRNGFVPAKRKWNYRER